MRRPPLRAALFAALFIAAVPLQASAQEPGQPAQEFDCPNQGPMASDGPHENVDYVTGDQGYTGGHVTVDDGILYVGSYGFGFLMYDVSDPANPVCLAYIGGTGLASADAVPDAAVFETPDGPRRIAALGGTGRVEGAPVPEANTNRTDFFDVTDPANPIYLETLGPGFEHGEAHNADIFDEEMLWLPSGGDGEWGFRIYDMSPLLAETPGEPELIFNMNPLELWAESPYYDEETEPIGTDTFTHTHDITIYPDYPVAGLGPRDIVLLAEGGSYLRSEPVFPGDTGSVFVIDITDPENPVVLFRWVHPPEIQEGEEHHPIRYHHEAQFLDGDPRVMLVTDEDLHSTPDCTRDAAGITAVRLSDDLQSSTEVSEWFIPVHPEAAVCSAHVFNSYNQYVFMGSYNAGLQIIDYSDPAAPERAGYYIASGATSWGAYYYEGYVYVGDVDRGLDVFRFHMPDLAVTDVTFSSDQTIEAGEQVTITATVGNIGEANVEGAVVRFTVNGTQIGADQTIESIVAGEDGTASVAWDTTGLSPGDYTVTATVDPDAAITEHDETNNSASGTVTVTAPPAAPPGGPRGGGLPNTSMSPPAEAPTLLVAGPR